MLNIRVVYNEEMPLHHDLLMDFDEIHVKVVADLYWFALDNFHLPNEETFSKALQILNILLGQWHETVGNLNENEERYLLFDVSDQYLGCLWVKRIAKEVEVSYGFYAVDAGAAPSAFRNELIDADKFRFTSESVRVPLTWFLTEIERERDKIGAMAEEEKSKPPPQEDQPHVERFSAMGGEIYLEFEGDIALAINGYHGEDQIFRLVEPTGRADKAMRRADDFLEEWFDSQQLLRRFE